MSNISLCHQFIAQNILYIKFVFAKDWFGYDECLRLISTSCWF